MRFASIYLSNYIGIYNGMGLNEIHIDLSKCRNRMLIIRGDNGSGKSTLFKAMNLFPDGNDSFIPGLPARKEIILEDNQTLYKLVFIHNIKSNGDRDTTKAYITKTFNDMAVELNENGNVSSYKDIIYSELGLDANFVALSQLSNDDRGLADKKPAERKRFVNSIISSLDTYNNIYKTLTKRSSNYKSMINGIVAKLSVLGDEKTLADNLEAIEQKINNIQDLKDKAVSELAKQQSLVSLLDPDGSIKSIESSVTAELELAQKNSDSVQSVIDNLMKSNNISSTDFKKTLNELQNKRNDLSIENQISRNTIETLMSQKEAEAVELDKKSKKLASLQNEYNYDILTEKVKELKSELDKISAELKSKVGIEDIMSITKDEYILALETLKDLDVYISTFKSYNDFSIIQSIINEYLETSQIPQIKNSDIYKNSIEEYSCKLMEIDKMKADILSKMDLLDRLKLRPKSCVDDNCEFIKGALDFANQNPKEKIDELDKESDKLNRKISLSKEEIKYNESYNDAVNQFSVIVREVNKNGGILSKLPNGDMFINKPVFFDRLISGYSFDYMKSIYEYIDLANLFDVYKSTRSVYDKCIAELKSFEGKTEMIESIISDINSINDVLTDIANRIEPLRDDINKRENEISIIKDLEGTYLTLIEKSEEKKEYQEKINKCRDILLENSRKINEINAAISKMQSISENINTLSYSLEPLMKDRDKISHSVQMMQDYLIERDELQKNYDFIEVLKHYSSPTTGIQLVFMELYMGKIISLANELLSLLFNGQFVIQPFVINESEFRIPCLGKGYMNDDISSMSSAQISMISMILSFALLHHSSSKYNIIKLDEIDGPLDYNNRIYFTDVLNNIMNIMGTEQCIIISHNSELQVDNSDVILLKHDIQNNEFNRGNIIWSY